MCQSIEAFAKTVGNFRQIVKVTDVALKDKLSGVSHWTVGEDGKSINRTFKFCNFVEAVGFMNDSAFIAEGLNHHPDWRNVHGTVSVRLTTHDLGGLTNLDFDLAKAMDQIASRRSKPVLSTQCAGQCSSHRVAGTGSC